MPAMSLLDDDEFVEAAEDRSREVEATVRLRAGSPGRIGPVLDQIRALIEQSGLEAELIVPGYHDTFYGYECDRDDAA